jgi:uncharacterized membrane protein YhaH (DUF805 family)
MKSKYPKQIETEIKEALKKESKEEANKSDKNSNSPQRTRIVTKDKKTAPQKDNTGEVSAFKTSSNNSIWPVVILGAVIALMGWLISSADQAELEHKVAILFITGPIALVAYLVTTKKVIRERLKSIGQSSLLLVGLVILAIVGFLVVKWLFGLFAGLSTSTIIFLIILYGLSKQNEQNRQKIEELEWKLRDKQDADY